MCVLVCPEKFLTHFISWLRQNNYPDNATVKRNEKKTVKINICLLHILHPQMTLLTSDFLSRK